MNLFPKLLNTFEIRTLDLEPDRRLDAGELHIKPVLDWHGPRVRQARKLELRVHFRDQLFVGHAGAPLLTRFECHRGVVHVERRIVGRAFGTANRAEYRRHFRERMEDPVLLLHQLRRLPD